MHKSLEAEEDKYINNNDITSNEKTISSLEELTNYNVDDVDDYISR